MPGVTISAGYGAGGRIVAPEVARRLGLPVLDRAISSRVAALLQVTVPEAEGGEIRRPLVDRVLALFTPLAGGVLCAGTDAAPPEAVPPPDDAALFRQHAEAIMNEALAAGAVVLGRAGAAAFRSRPDVLRVRLSGSREARAFAPGMASVVIATAFGGPEVLSVAGEVLRSSRCAAARRAACRRPRAARPRTAPPSRRNGRGRTTAAARRGMRQAR